ncbi:hypothetical protein NMY22_g15474 [Coprinellus aureogranulatus]|nr:hypothetical protein NMY22_g15474 [Coprinellus aureogranulatus]
MHWVRVLGRTRRVWDRGLIGRIAPPWLAKAPPGATAAEKQKIRRPYGNGRMETVLMFAQAVYLMFSSVYVCKEAVEHLLLSTGGQEGHHHHSGDEDPHSGIEFPTIIMFLTIASLLASAFFYENNIQLVNLSSNRLPTLDAFISLYFSKWSNQQPISVHHRVADLVIALTITVLTFRVSYRACVVPSGSSPSSL